MIVESATVIDVKGDVVTVQAAIKTTCNGCQANDDCGTGVISRALAPKSQQLTLKTPTPVKVGDVVKIGVPEKGVLTASAWLYLLPLTVFLLTALLFNFILPVVGFTNELWVLLASSIVTFVGFLLSSRHLKSIETAKFQPVILSNTDFH